MRVVPARSAGSRRVRLLVMGKLADQGALFLGSLLVARAVGPAAFAPVGVLLIVNSMSVQLSDLGLGFAVHSSPIDCPGPRAEPSHDARRRARRRGRSGPRSRG